jgi:hypothetical protein
MDNGKFVVPTQQEFEKLSDLWYEADREFKELNYWIEMFELKKGTRHEKKTLPGEYFRAKESRTMAEVRINDLWIQKDEAQERIYDAETYGIANAIKLAADRRAQRRANEECLIKEKQAWVTRQAERQAMDDEVSRLEKKMLA